MEDMELRENNAIPNDLQTGDKVVICDGIHIWGGRTGVVKSFDGNNPLNLRVDISRDTEREIIVGLNKFEIIKL